MHGWILGRTTSYVWHGSHKVVCVENGFLLPFCILHCLPLPLQLLPLLCVDIILVVVVVFVIVAVGAVVTRLPGLHLPLSSSLCSVQEPFFVCYRCRCRYCCSVGKKIWQNMTMKHKNGKLLPRIFLCSSYYSRVADQVLLWKISASIPRFVENYRLYTLRLYTYKRNNIVSIPSPGRAPHRTHTHTQIHQHCLKNNFTSFGRWNFFFFFFVSLFL